MPDRSANDEPILSQVPTGELRRILTDRFARDIGAEAARRVLRPITFFGLPGIALAGGLVWQLLDASVSTKVNAMRDAVSASVNASLQPLL